MSVDLTGTVTAVVINFRTPDLTTRAVTSFRRFYPRLLLLIIDNGSGAGDFVRLQQLSASAPDVITLITNPANLHHGPAMDQASRLARTPFVLFLDSDCEILRGGFLEGMLELLSDGPPRYAVGKKILMNDRGFDVTENGHEYVRPVCMLMNRALYRELPPFERHGAPCLANMRAASERGLQLLHFPIDDYVRHDGRGTAGRHGYRLGWRGRLNHMLNRLGF